MANEYQLSYTAEEINDKLGQIEQLSEEIADHEARITQLEENQNTGGGNSEETNSIPDYWVSELETKADAIQTAMEKAGRNKSAFLWYTDAHWPHNSKMSPVLLDYLVKNTPMNKVNFGGDIIGDPSPHNHANTKYAYEWRKLISGLPNHHSVYGNHDVYHRAANVNDIAYSQLLAPEESTEMIVGGESYYYIDNPAEKTRYLYLAYIAAGAGFSDSDTAAEMVAQGKFITSTLASVADGWHIVVIAHRWYQYTKDANNQLVIDGGSFPFYEAEILRVFDAYNARATTHTSPNYIVPVDFTSAKGKVEFCIGGHCHLDYDFTTDGGVPVIITASDANQERNTGETEDNGTIGTITESAVFGIIADYTDAANTKITVVGVGRGTSRIIGGNSEPDEPVPIVNLFDKNDPDVVITGRINSSGNAVNYAEGQLVTGFIEGKVGDTFTIKSDKPNTANLYVGSTNCFRADKSYIINLSTQHTANGTVTMSEDGMTVICVIPSTYNTTDFSSTAFVRFCVAYTDIDSIVITKS